MCAQRIGCGNHKRNIGGPLGPLEFFFGRVKGIADLWVSKSHAATDCVDVGDNPLCCSVAMDPSFPGNLQL